MSLTFSTDCRILSVMAKKRVALARALITQPDIMIYDEPTTGQDPIMMKRVDDMIVEASQNFEITSIVISRHALHISNCRPNSHD